MKPISWTENDGSEDYGLFIVFLLLIAWLPLPLGSNRAWAWSIMQIWVFTLLAIWLARHWRRPFPSNPALAAARGPIIALTLWLAYTLLQIIPLPGAVLSMASPAAYALHSFDDSSPATGWAPLSIDQGASMTEFLKACSYVSILLLTLILANSVKRLRILAFVMAGVGFGEALYGLILHFTGTEYIWLQSKMYYRGFVTGTFINRNHMAGHMEMTISVAIGFLLAGRPSLNFNHGLKSFFRIMISSIMGSWGFLVIGAIIMFSALFLSGSRGGVGSLFFALLSVYSLVFFAGIIRKREATTGPFLLGLFLASALWLGLGQLPERYEETDVSLEQRTGLWRQTLDIAADYPMTGSGAGTFQSIFPLYDSGHSPRFFDHAHNDYVELLADQGLIGFALLASALALFFRILISALKTRRDHFMRGMLVASSVGVTSLMYHSVVDFNMHIPANAAYFFTLIGIGIASSITPSSGAPNRNQPN